MTYTQAQIDRANAANLEDFLRAQGETLVRSGKEYRWKAHDSLTVCGNKWFRHSQSKGGYPVDFVMEFYGKSFPEAVQMLTGELGEVQPEADPTPSPAFRLPLRNVTNANILNYLTQERKTQQAKDLICTLLAGGKRVYSEDIDKAALDKGIPSRTVRDAKRELGNALKSKIGEGRRKVFWME